MNNSGFVLSRWISTQSLTRASPRSFISNRMANWFLIDWISHFTFPTISKSSTYNATSTTPELLWSVYKHGSLRLLLNCSCLTRKLCILAYHCLGDCLNPYNYFKSRQTFLEFDADFKPSGIAMNICCSSSPFRKAVITSICCTNCCKNDNRSMCLVEVSTSDLPAANCSYSNLWSVVLDFEYVHTK